MKQYPLEREQNFHEIIGRHDPVVVIVSPPRCSSTAFARVFWEHPAIAYYSHEPFETIYYQGDTLRGVANKLAHSIPLGNVKRIHSDSACRGLVIKEMPYQVGRHFPLLASFATVPIIFLIRDPRLNIASRMAKKTEVGDSPIFPKIESGWELLESHIRWCRATEVEHVIVDASDFRNEPLTIFPQLFARLGLPFSAEMLSWQPANIELDNLDGQHRHLYAKVLDSSGLMPATEPIPSVESFPIEGGFRAHVQHCLKIYQRLYEAEERIIIRQRTQVQADFPMLVSKLNATGNQQLATS